jgi:hypothetical protein
MSLISAYKPEKRKKTDELEAYKTVINKHRENFIGVASYKPVDLKYAQQIASYEVFKIRTAYINNSTFSFGNKLRNMISLLTRNRKGKLDTINSDETNDKNSKKKVEAKHLKTSRMLNPLYHQKKKGRFTCNIIR